VAATDPNSLIHHLRRLAAGHGGPARSDAELLGAFVESRDQAAFAALVGRHGPMVFGVCSRLLGPQDAEDAFQATFFVLARKAGSVAPREMVANWLYGVAYRTSVKARALTVRRRGRERPLAGAPEPEAKPAGGAPDDLGPLIDRELSGLPDKYRVPVVLCDLEGKTRPEAARQLGWPEGTLSWRLAAGRKMLADRLTRRGVTPFEASLGVSAAGPSGALVPPELAASAVRSAVLFSACPAAAAGVVPGASALAKGVMRAMLVNKLRPVLAVLAVLVLLGGGIFALAVDEKPSATRSPDRAPQPLVGPARAEEQPAKAEEPPAKEDGFVWGDPMDAVRAGLAVRAGGPPAVAPGGSVRLVIKLRNDGDQPAVVTYVVAPFETFRPIVADEDGQGMRVVMPPFVSRSKPLRERTLKPGAEIEIGGEEMALDPQGKLVPVHLPELTFALPVEGRPEVSTPTAFVKPGRYTVRYAGFLQSHPKLSTGELAVEVKGTPPGR
jgi:RNA polymerase sigma factor (sigma-70 family)